MAGRRAALARLACIVFSLFAASAVAAAKPSSSTTPGMAMPMPTAASAEVQAQRARDAKVVPDVIDTISPSVQLRVSYADGVAVAGGERLTVVQTAAKPTVEMLDADPAAFYTLMMVDPDAPDPAEPTFRSWLHWLVVDVPGGAAPAKGRSLIAYMGPKPPRGVHRYVFLLFKQQAELGAKRAQQAAPPERNSFNVRDFAAATKLGDPVGVNFFDVEKAAETRHKEH